MKLKFSTLHLLALSHVVAASPCRPQSSSVTTFDVITEGLTTTESVPFSETAVPLSSTAIEVEAETTESVVTFETVTASESATTFEATTASDTEAVLMESITSSGAATSSEATINKTSDTETESIPTSQGNVRSQTTTDSGAEIDTTTSESVTTFEPATPTSDVPIISTISFEPTATTSTLSQGPTNLLVNPSFEDDTISPWFKLINVGTYSLSTTQSRTGTQSASITARRPGGVPATLGFAQSIDLSLLEAGKPYEFSAYTKSTFRDQCASRTISCKSRDATVNYVIYRVEDDDWEYMKITCAWTQAQLDSGPRVLLSRLCRGLDWYIDDAMLVEAV
ncbi:hypothetical protein NW768_007993 [Fusarium equiseti]|uniref:CBM-cenC domain-containing protein n=1 Tax=Fusarium equiseti TaxID=61235 RepID=A0ABQ8R5R3_FUSEQ|nr:hypothetical protein NW768_007993 [Fusarium equiseti]